MKITSLASLILLLPFSAPQAKWFEESNTIAQMHKSLLQDDLDGMFEQMVQVWQQESEQYIRPHLDALLEQAVSKDCGKSLMTQSLPTWLTSINISRNTTQRPGRTSHKLVITIDSQSKLDSIDFIRWPERHISAEHQIFQKTEKIYNDDRQMHTTQKVYNIPRRLDSGLYQLTIKDNDGESWNSWVIIDAIKPPQSVRWESRDKWVVDKTKLLNRACPLPRQEIQVSEYKEGKYSQVWSNSYESPRYPTHLPKNAIEANRYLLSVSMVNSRWQGPVVIQQQNTISKTIDLTEE
ncbi:DUF2861 family protein [Vibrio gallicus]|uniref:DUF2861 family protein n=1 Tax=Vibrio gallicus TaxID=190897 RepID=UPI0021C39C72|nr:DUF2861 family protein [Vibrio gallicus]